MRASLAIGLMCVAGCGRIGYDAVPSDAIDSGPSTPDAKALPSPVVECSLGLPILPTAPAFEMVEPAMHPSGLSLILRRRQGSNPLLQTNRADVNASFGALDVPSLVRTNLEDPAFLEIDGVTAAFAASKATPRQLVFCPAASDTNVCLDMTVFDEFGAAIIDDIDGPTLAMQEGVPFLVFSRGFSIYSARSRDSTYLEWDARAIAFPFDTDDPTLSQDGTLMLTEVTTGDVNDGLYALVWDETNKSFGPAERVLGTTFTGPEFGRQTDTGFELFFEDTTRGVLEVHRSDCTLAFE